MIGSGRPMLVVLLGAPAVCLARLSKAALVSLLAGWGSGMNKQSREAGPSRLEARQEARSGRSQLQVKACNNKSAQSSQAGYWFVSAPAWASLSALGHTTRARNHDGDEYHLGAQLTLFTRRLAHV